ncbi:uncharacterized protein LOC118017140 [Mirounga leonina]|uniref:uncharacterized protein LOC118017140 n=1 Tax=Mirounga leonina TaxID=9715 RepID=UPI00156C2CB5|nr:uncharacterized protein LOC118017140 [Mirounga leonina]
MEKTLSPKRRGCGEGCVWLLGGELLVGTLGGASETDFEGPRVRTDFGPAAPTCRAAGNQRVTPSGNAAPPGRLASGWGLHPAGIRVSSPARPCSAGEWIGAAPRLRDVGEHPGRGSRARVSAAAGTARARPQERAGLGVRLARVSAGASGRREAGATGWAREAGWGLRSRLQSLARQRGATRGRAARSRRLSGAHRLGTRTPSPPYRRSGVQRCPCPCPGVAAMAAPLGRAHFPREGRVLWAGGAGTAPLRLWAEPLHVDGDRLSSPAACLGSETRRQNAHPAPIGAPALSPQSPSFALLRQHHALARSRSREKLRHQAWFPEPAGTVETLPESSTAWKSYHLGSLRLGGTDSWLTKKNSSRERKDISEV